MLVIGRGVGQRVYIGTACVIEVVDIDKLGNAVLKIWEGGAPRQVSLVRFGLSAKFCAGSVMISNGAPHAPARLAFDVPKAVPIQRGELLTPEERGRRNAAAGFK